MDREIVCPALAFARSILLSLALLPVMVLHSTAQDDWHSATFGPPGGIVNGIGSDQQNVVMATDRGVASTASLRYPFRLDRRATGVAVFGGIVLVSADSGRVIRIDNWTTATEAIVDTGLRSLRILYSDGRRAYAGAVASSGDPIRVYRTDDTGATWKRLFSAAEGWEIQSVSVWQDTIALGSGSGIWQSANDGVTWDLLTRRSLTHVLVSGGWIFGAGTDGFGFSSDGGRVWRYSSIPVPDVTGLVSGDGLLIGSGIGVYRSIDTGLTWNPYSTGITNHSVTTLARIGDSLLAGTAGGGVNYRTPGSDRWRPLPLWLTARVNAIAYHDDPMGYPVFLGTDGGVYVSRELHDEAWDYSGLHDRITSLATLGSVAFAGSADSGIFRSVDLGATWAHASVGLGDTATRVLALLSSGRTLLAATNAGIYRSLDSGTTWLASNVDAFSMFRMLRAGSFTSMNGGFCFGGAGYFLNDDLGVLLESTDEGASWRNVAENTAPPIDALAANGSRLWCGVAGMYARGLRYSDDGGTTWNPVSLDAGAGEPRVYALAVDSVRWGPHLLIGCDRGAIDLDLQVPSWGPMLSGPSVISIATRGISTGTEGGFMRTAGFIDAGAWHWWQVLIGRVNEAGPMAITMSPNPAGDYIDVGIDDDSPRRIMLRDIHGRVLREGHFAHAGQRRTTRIATHDIPSGLYELTVRTGKSESTALIIIVR